MPETSTMREVFDAKAKPAGLSWDQFARYLADDTHPRRVMVLEEVANVAAFVRPTRRAG